MKNKVYYLTISIVLVSIFHGCKIHTPCTSFNQVYKLHSKEISEKNNGNYFLCYIEEYPQIYTVDSALNKALSKHIKIKEIDYNVIKLKVKPIDMYFSKFSRDEALKMWSALYFSFLQQGDKYHDPLKESFLNFNTLYFITCSDFDLKKLNRLYTKKMLVIFDLKSEELMYLFSFNAYSATNINFNKLYSFDEVLKDYLEAKAKGNATSTPKP